MSTPTTVESTATATSTGPDPKTPLVSVSDHTAGPAGDIKEPSIGQKFARNKLSWISLVLTILLFVSTIIYACRPTFAMKYRIIRASSSHTIFILRAMSQMVDALLAICLMTAFERIQWFLVARNERGASFALISATSPSTGVVGLCQMLCRRTTGLGPARMWSLVRLLSLSLLLAMGLLIMSMTTILYLWLIQLTSI